MIEEFYKTNLSWNKKISSIIGKEHSNIDPHILNRDPRLSFTEEEKTTLFNSTAREYNNYYSWWKDSITVWKVK